MEQEKKKSKLKIIIPIIVVIVIIAVVFATRYAGNNLNKPSIESAETLDWEKVTEEFEKNPARAKEYENKWYKYTGVVTDITSGHCSVSNVIILNNYVHNIWIYFSDGTETLKKLNKGDKITVFGKLTKVSDFSDMKNAELVEIVSTGNPIPPYK